MSKKQTRHAHSVKAMSDRLARFAQTSARQATTYPTSLKLRRTSPNTKCCMVRDLSLRLRFPESEKLCLPHTSRFIGIGVGVPAELRIGRVGMASFDRTQEMGGQTTYRAMEREKLTSPSSKYSSNASSRDSRASFLYRQNWKPRC